MVSMSYGKEKIIISVREKIIKEKDICEHCFYPLCLFFPQRTPLISRQSILKHFLNLKKKKRNEKEKKKRRLLFLELVFPGRISFVERKSTASRSIIVFPSSRSSCHEGCFLVVPPAI